MQHYPSTCIDDLVSDQTDTHADPVNHPESICQEGAVSGDRSHRYGYCIASTSTDDDRQADSQLFALLFLRQTNFPQLQIEASTGCTFPAQLLSVPSPCEAFE